MENKLVIKGGKKLRGEVTISSSKNARFINPKCISHTKILEKGQKLKSFAQNNLTAVSFHPL